MSQAGDSGSAGTGFDTGAVERWIATHVPALTLPLSWQRLPGGHSNITFLVTDAGGRKAVIRRPPLGTLLPKAHDMGREWRLISALGQTAVPVPAALGFCESLDVTGSVFYVMGYIDGLPLVTLADVQRRYPEALLPGIAFGLVDVLADLHAVDPAAVGLADLSKGDGYVARQLASWHKSWLASATSAQYDDPRASALYEFLKARVPDQGAPRLVHGDYGLHNVLIDAAGRIAAVIDWELSTLGDPLADFAYFVNQWPEPGDPASTRSDAPTLARGFPRREDLVRRYAERTGRDLAQLGFYLGFTSWRTAAIMQGAYARYMAGTKSAEGVNLAQLRDSIGRNLDRAERALAAERGDNAGKT